MTTETVTRMKCGKGHYHASVAEIRACYNGEIVKDITPERPATWAAPTSKQVAYLEALLAKNGVRFALGIETLDRRSISKAIDQLNSGAFRDYPKTFAPVEPEAPVAKEAPKPAFDSEQLEDGFYVLVAEDGSKSVYKIIRAVHGSGRKYAKQLDTESGEWVMARGAIRKIRPEHKMTLQEALEVAKAVNASPESRLYGRCWKCGRELTDEDSIERMMGPICADKF